VKDVSVKMIKSLVFIPSSSPHLAYTFHSQEVGMSNVFLTKREYLRVDSSEFASPHNKAGFRTGRKGQSTRLPEGKKDNDNS
jgi:hypothetical protein